MRKKLTPQQRLINFVCIIILGVGIISTTLLVFLFSLYRLSWGFSSWQPVWPIFLIMGIFLILCLTCHVLLKALQSYKSGLFIFSNKQVKKNIYYGLTIILALLAIVLASTTFWSIINEQPPQFFPFDDDEATYTVAKRNNKYTLIYNSNGNSNSHYVCDKRNGTTNCRTEVYHNAEIVIGNSPTNLEALLDKQAVVRGYFSYSNQQCIADTCHDIGRMAVVNIKSIKPINN